MKMKTEQKKKLMLEEVMKKFEKTEKIIEVILLGRNKIFRVWLK